MATRIIDQDETTSIEGAFVVSEKENATKFEKVDLQTVADKAKEYSGKGIESIAEACGLEEKSVAVGDPPEWEADFDDSSNYMKEADFVAASLEVNLKNRTKLLDAAIKGVADDISNEIGAIETHSETLTAAADEASGTATNVNSSLGWLEEITANFVVDAYVGKVCLLEEGSKKECALIISNTNTKLTFDESLENSYFTPNYRILDTKTITSEKEQIIACDTTVNDMAIVLPTVSASNDRKKIEIYTEDGNNKVYIVAPEINKIKISDTIKWLCLEATNELVELKPHNVSGAHFDLTNLVFSQSFCSMYRTDDYTTAESTNPHSLMASDGNMNVDNIRRFNELIDNGFNTYAYASPKKKLFFLQANIVINKNAGGSTAGEYSIYFRKNENPLNRIVTTTFGNSDGTQTLVINDVVELERGDRIDLYGERTSDTGVYTIIAGSSIIIKD